MPYSEVQVANLALALIGAGRIASLNDASREARDCKALLPLLRDEVLESYPWRFARGRAELAQLTAAPTFGWDYAYQLPADCVRPLALSDAATRFEVEGDQLLCDLAEDVFLHYTRRIENAAKFTPSFVSALSARMAADLAMTIPKDKSLAEKMWNLYQNRISGLQTIDNRSSNPPTEDELATAGASPYVEARS